MGSLAQTTPVYGPTEHRSFIIFKKISKPSELQLDYISHFAMTAPRSFIYHPVETVLKFELNGSSLVEETVSDRQQIVFGVHPCDLSAINVLDKTFISTYVDSGYTRRRELSTLIGLNCSRVGPACFCSSMGTGPFYHQSKGCDLLLTDLGDKFLAEMMTDKGKELIGDVEILKASSHDIELSEKLEEACLNSFEKHLETDGLPELLGETLDHPVYKRVADSRCLNCANCVMVCPTCFCYDLKDETEMNFKTVNRVKRWDACQELHFAEVHGGNFRKTREARLRQWVTHKLGTWVEQFGTFGCIGCGRCMTWCPTNIDLAFMAQEIQGVIPLA